MQYDTEYMRKVLTLAKKGQGHVHPNPLVGSIIVKNRHILGQGLHQKYGESHAEVNAIKSAKESPEGATMFVNLEPCTYHGKTPPCVPAIIESGIEKVVIGMRDPNPKVDGMGIRQLREAGIEVIVGVLEQEARELNRGFVHQIQHGYPWVTLKIALTIDGFMADNDGTSKWITNRESRQEVHRLRAEHDAILIGSGTAVKDNPQLTVRSVEGQSPVRFILDPERRTPESAQVFRIDEAETVVVTAANSGNGQSGITEFPNEILLPVNESNQFDWGDVLAALYKNRGILSVFVEGGSGVAGTLLESGYVTELITMTGPKLIGQGLSPFKSMQRTMQKAEHWKIHKLSQFGDDVCVRYRREDL
ncbi:MAG: bifunctional diaminohydroxyphosphoribosylaminopyrimidine deaminase/5-amino-6-(5-phosphoribosylamino)uracil reductase RibD [Candidatus Marinimicrobia bacterium]|nr:bifunctional diaminohydroxyphosphoribosylaminopyrimidine deaminase/5-amino-6-(5-phosphoribosylamino)uracil reductase RibD [Candidatus Neomarinimicrobiota bacterium]